MRLYFSRQFNKSFSAIKEVRVKRQVWNKILELEDRAPIGKKLKGNPYWSIHVSRYRIVYGINGTDVYIADVLPRKNDYRSIGL